MGDVKNNLERFSMLFPKCLRNISGKTTSQEAQWKMKKEKCVIQRKAKKLSLFKIFCWTKGAKPRVKQIK